MEDLRTEGPSYNGWFVPTTAGGTGTKFKAEIVNTQDTEYLRLLGKGRNVLLSLSSIEKCSNISPNLLYYRHSEDLPTSRRIQTFNQKVTLKEISLPS